MSIFDLLMKKTHIANQIKSLESDMGKENLAGQKHGWEFTTRKLITDDEFETLIEAYVGGLVGTLKGKQHVYRIYPRTGIIDMVKIMHQIPVELFFRKVKGRGNDEFTKRHELFTEKVELHTQKWDVEQAILKEWELIVSHIAGEEQYERDTQEWVVQNEILVTACPFVGKD